MERSENTTAAAAGAGPIPVVPETSPPWTRLADGVWERRVDGNETEQYAAGFAGMAWALQRVKAASADMFRAFIADRRMEVWQDLENHRRLVRDLERMIALADETEEPVAARPAFCDAALSCRNEFDANASSSLLTPGAIAQASATWWNDAGHKGYVYAAAVVEVEGVADLRYRFGSSRTSTSATVLAAVPGDGEAYALSSAWVAVPTLGLFYEVGPVSEGLPRSAAPVS